MKKRGDNMKTELEIKREIRNLKEQHLKLQDKPDFQHTVRNLEIQIDMLEWVLRDGCVQ